MHREFGANTRVVAIADGTRPLKIRPASISANCCVWSKTVKARCFDQAG